jgi:hypothetical protein
MVRGNQPFREDRPGDKRQTAASRSAGPVAKLMRCPLFWLNYRNSKHRAVVVVEAEALVAARMKAALGSVSV